MQTPLHALEAKVTRLAERVERHSGGRINRLSVLASTTRRGVMTSTAAALTLAVTSVCSGDEWVGLRWGPAGILDPVILRAVRASEAPAVVFPIALPALSLGLVLSGTVVLGGPVGAFEVQP